jgi:hypothetical protein
MASGVTVLNSCPDDVGQIQKLIFWRRGNSMSVASALTSTAWTNLFLATDDTKAIVSPFVGNVELPVNDPREFGGSNETRGGKIIRKGGSSPVFSASMYQEDQDVITSLKALHCEALDVLFVNESNQLIYDSRSGVVYGFEVINGSLNVSDKGVGGQDDADVNIITFNLKPDWS